MDLAQCLLLNFYFKLRLPAVTIVYTAALI